ncbi:hypothetical protein SDC9_122975 [bioreactor metagenome]|uniref:Uncharacterized protein n=1 Tax=bioreactor metagenome TaxID=1076179 RepID=A0A645CGA9_9ZZZZ|nr:hypothetical protein [Lachnospiraceae bacterium]
MIQKNKRPLPKEFCIQKTAAPPSADTLKEEPKVIFTAESSHKKVQKKVPPQPNVPAANSKNIIAPAVAAILLMDVLNNGNTD